jgi:hypothetical protein
MDERNGGPCRRQAKQTVRQAARRALEAQPVPHAHSAETGCRLSLPGVTVLVAIGERNATDAAYGQRAGQALLTMTDTDQLSLREASAWCGPGPTTQNAASLRDFMTEAVPTQSRRAVGASAILDARELCDD